MPDLYDYLQRFRRLLVPPGAPGRRARMPSAPPGLEDELRAIFAEIDRIDEERIQIGAGVEREMTLLRAEAEEACQQRMDEARGQADEGYARAYRERADELGERFDELMTEAQSEVARIERDGASRARELGREVARAIVELATAPAPARQQRPAAPSAGDEGQA